MNIVSLTVAFCSGIVVSELGIGLVNNAGTWFTWLRRVKPPQWALDTFCFAKHSGRANSEPARGECVQRVRVEPSPLGRRPHLFCLSFLTLVVLAGTIAFLTWLKFPFIAQITFLALCTFATRQICFIGGKIGLIQFGRFSTYILVPMFLIFNLTFLQLTMVFAFFNICAATASDTIFDLKTSSLSNTSRRKTWISQWIGLVGISLSLGIIFYLLFTNLHLGSPDFFAQRSQTKALLLQTLHFDFYVVLFGVIYGLIVKQFGLSPTMVFGGIIMPNSISIGLMIGALLSLVVKNRDKYLSFSAGVWRGCGDPAHAPISHANDPLEALNATSLPSPQ